MRGSFKCRDEDRDARETSPADPDERPTRTGSIQPVEAPRMKLARIAATALGVLLLASAPAQAKTVVVPRDYLTIQAAVDAAAPGDTVIVGSGTYTEQVVIGKDLDLRGAGVGATVIKAPATLTPYAVNLRNSRSVTTIVRVGRGAHASISGLTVSGPTPCGLVSAVVAGQAATLDLSDARISDILPGAAGCPDPPAGRAEKRMPEHDAKAIHLALGEGAICKHPLGGALKFKLRGKETHGALTVFESTVAAGEGPPLHVHANEDEVWYGLEGTFRVKLDDDIQEARAGTFVFIPRGVQHTWQNIGDAPARILVVVTPAGLERFFERFAQLPDDASVPVAFRRLGREVGMDVVGPPLAQSDPL
jgi:quercetin dioxygenase-like cupin family protein